MSQIWGVAQSAEVTQGSPTARPHAAIEIRMNKTYRKERFIVESADLGAKGITTAYQILARMRNRSTHLIHRPVMWDSLPPHFLPSLVGRQCDSLI